MKLTSVPRIARVAAIGGTLLLGIALQPGVATAAITCESRSSGKDAAFYGGKSASYAYDRPFHAGGPKIPIPWLSTHTPQGVATWHNFSRGRNLLLVSSYRDGANARLSAVDPGTGRRVGTVEIAPTHAGGVTITKGWAFVQGRGSTIRKYKLSRLKKKMRRSGIPTSSRTGRLARSTAPPS